MKKINWILKFVLFISGIIYTIKYGFEKEFSYTLIALALLVIVFVPAILKKIKIELLPEMEFLFLIFVLLAQLLGSLMKLYDQIWYFDKLVHFASGFLSSLVGIYLLVKSEKYDKKSIGFNCLFIIFTALSVASIWEIFEFTCDNILGNDAQRVLNSGVTDTMLDIIVAFLAAILISVMYAFEEVNKKTMVIKQYISKIR